MTNSQIKQELRRSACEDVDPWMRLDESAFSYVRKYVGGRIVVSLANEQVIVRTLFLLVAEAL